MPLLFPVWVPETGSEYSMRCNNDFFCLVYTRAGRNGSSVLSYHVTIATDKQMNLKRLVIAKSLHVRAHRYKSTL